MKFKIHKMNVVSQSDMEFLGVVCFGCPFHHLYFTVLQAVEECGTLSSGYLYWILFCPVLSKAFSFFFSLVSSHFCLNSFFVFDEVWGISMHILQMNKI